MSINLIRSFRVPIVNEGENVRHTIRIERIELRDKKLLGE